MVPAPVGAVLGAVGEVMVAGGVVGGEGRVAISMCSLSLGTVPVYVDVPPGRYWPAGAVNCTVAVVGGAAGKAVGCALTGDEVAWLGTSAEAALGAVVA